MNPTGINQYKGKRITVFGLGLNGGGVASAAFFAGRGAKVTVTDLRTKEELADSIEKLTAYDITYRLGEHIDTDFIEADIVIKNPAIPSTSRFLKLAKKVDTDISIFLKSCDNPILAITGSKGKSTTVTALHHILKGAFPHTQLGGNITVSPLSFLDKLTSADTPIVLELSSWQLADLPDPTLLKPQISVITNIMKDHQNRYNSMADYINDKKVIYQNQSGDDISLFPFNDFGKECAKEIESKSLGRSLFFSEERSDDPAVMGFREGDQIFLRVGEEFVPLLGDDFTLPGLHIRLNILIAAIIAFLFGLTPSSIMERIATFKGVAHRLEWIRKAGEIDFYNDTTATIPDALVAAVKSFTGPTVFIAGGNDKELDFSVLTGVMQQPLGIVLLEGDGTNKIIEILKDENISFSGPYNSFKEALNETYRLAQNIAAKLKETDTAVAVVLSPGCTSFGMFMNEFDRGDQFRDFVENL